MDVFGPLLLVSGRKSRRPATSKSIILEKKKYASYLSDVNELILDNEKCFQVSDNVF